MPVLHATPYDISHAGFYFESAKDFQTKMSTALFEEVEIQFIDGTEAECLVFKLFKSHQGNVAEYFAALDVGYEGHQLAALSYIVEYQGTAWAEAVEALDDADVYEMTIKELAEHFAEEGIYPAGVNEQILPYLDYEMLARDLSMDYTEITCLGSTYCVRVS